MAASLSSLFGIDLPIIQAPMAGVQNSALTIAVSNAGALGSLPAAMLSTDALRQELRTITDHTTKPYNVNFFCHQPPVPDAEREAGWCAALLPYYVELGIDPAAIPVAPARMPFDMAFADVLAEFCPAVVSFHFGLPSDLLVQRVRRCGAKILSSATTIDEARWLEKRGVDAIIAQGTEAGGHRGHFLSHDLSAQLPTSALVTQIVRAVSVPVIAAGGIANANGVAAAMALGVAGVQVGTPYLLCNEATTSTLHREALKSASAHTTALTNVFTGRPARGIINRAIRELGPISAVAPDFPLAAAAMAPLRAAAEHLGRADFSPLWAGQNTSGCKETSAAELTRELARLL